MPTILDKLNQQESQPADLAAQAGTSTTNRLQQILQQTTGKQPATSAPQQNFAEQAAVGQAVQGAKEAEGQQVLTEAELRNQSAAQAASAAAATAGTTQQVKTQAQQYADNASQIMSRYEQGGQQLDLEKNQFDAQQLGFNMRLSNEQYTTRLSQEGQLRRLQDAASFQEETAKAVMGEELNTLGGHLDWQTAMQANQDEWNKALQDVSLQEWLDMAQYANKTGNTAAMTQGAAGIGTGAAMAYAASGKSTTSAPTAPDELNPESSTGVGPSSADNFNGPSKDLAPNFVGPPSSAATPAAGGNQ